MVAGSDSELARGMVQRLHRMLQGIERARRSPNRREAYHIAMAIEHVHAGRLTEGEEAIRRTQRVGPIPAEIAARTFLYEPPTAGQLCGPLDQAARNPSLYHPLHPPRPSLARSSPGHSSLSRVHI